MNDVTILLFGASGDLARRKMFPALYHMLASQKIRNFAIVGAAIDDTTADALIEGARAFIANVHDDLLNQMRERTFYHRLNFRDQKDFASLSAQLKKIESQFNLSGNRMIYLAAPANFFCDITNNLAASKIATRKNEHERPWNRIVYEKPFGNDLASAHEINECIKKSFDESQIYRIDHYLTKELVSNIALVRFTNCVFEPLWNNRYIDQVQITISEKIGIENRGAYYDTYGALSDVMQNHMLELVALIGMESPQQLTGNYIRSKRVEVLKEIEVVDGILGQFEGYHSEQHVAPDSSTETFAALMLRVNNPRWAGVPFYVKTGKSLAKKETVIDIKFKSVDCLFTHNCPVPSNWLRLEVAPEASFALNLNVKKPGYGDQVVPVAMEFCHSCLFGEQTPEAYEVILEEVMKGEQSISVRFDEIEYAWKIIDRVRAMNLPVYSYPSGSTGPKELVTLFEDKHGMRWKA